MKDKAQLNKSYNCTPKIYIYKSYKNKKYKQNTIKMLEQSHINKKKNSKKKKIKQLPSFFFKQCALALHRNRLVRALCILTIYAFKPT